MGTAESKGKKDMSLKIKSAEEILQQYFEDDNYVISCGMALSNAAIIRAMEEYAAQFKPTAEANANTVLDVVAATEDMKCCGNCAHTKECDTQGWQFCADWMSDYFDRSIRDYKPQQ